VSDPLIDILGSDYADRLSDHEALTNLNRPLAGLDLVLVRAAERLRDNDTGRFRGEVGKRVDKLSELHSEMTIARGKGSMEKMHSYSKQLSAAVDELRDYCAVAMEDLQAEKAFVKIIERVSRNMGEAWKIKLSAANVLSQAEVARVMGQIASIITESLPKDAAQMIVGRIKNEVFVNKMSGNQLDE
jgi:hypothetical protein